MEQIAFWEVQVSPKVVNVASVPHRSPFRYPGGKTWFVPKVRQWLRSLPVQLKTFIEPFAGGAIIGLTVAFEKLADSVVLVEKDEQVAAVWQTIINTDDGAEWLAEKIVNFKPTPESVRTLLSSETTSLRDLAFKTIIQNRVSHGGILAEGAGLVKNGEKGKGILSRWYPSTLKRRILDIAIVKHNLKFINGDGFQTIKKFSGSTDVVFFVDPPYTASKKKAGSRLYKYHQVDHEELFKLMSEVKGDFLMTYDDAEEVRDLAKEHNFETCLVAMTNTHNATMTELVIGRDLGWVK
ncbi:MAG: DNA adenine methylase [Chloroflexota bacterium]